VEAKGFVTDDEVYRLDVKSPALGGAEVERNVQNRTCAIGTESAAF
jgi:hypothetical protein